MSSTGSSRPCDQDVLAFLTEYKRPETRQRFEKLATLTRKECDELLESIAIKGVVQSRTKKYDSLEKKLNDLVKDSEFRDWVSKGDDIYKHHEMGDLAGVRIGLYFPDDILKVAKEIEKRFDMKHLFGTVSGGRDVTQGRNLDVQKHTNGPWRSRDLDGTDEYWENYGYKSWQMVVEWKKPPPQGLKSFRVEIQVGTVVTQAWAEVQHNIIYKRPTDILSTPTMKRMIDGINGLAITTDIMLKELERSLEQAKKEAEARRRQSFKDGAEFIKWFQSTYISQMRPEEQQRWVRRQDNDTANWLIWLCNRGTYYDDDCPTPCPTEFKELIEKKRLLHPKTKTVQELDVSEFLLQALGYVKGTENRREGSYVRWRHFSEPEYLYEGHGPSNVSGFDGPGTLSPNRPNLKAGYFGQRSNKHLY